MRLVSRYGYVWRTNPACPSRRSRNCLIGPPRLRPHWRIRPLRSALGPEWGVSRCTRPEAHCRCTDSRRRSKEAEALRRSCREGSITESRQLRLVVGPTAFHLHPYLEIDGTAEDAFHVDPRLRCDGFHSRTGGADQNGALIGLVNVDGGVNLPQVAALLEAFDGAGRCGRHFFAQQPENFFADQFGRQKALVAIGHIRFRI